MYEYYILVRSVTYAQKVSQLLDARGINNRIVRRPRGIQIGGCGYAVATKASPTGGASEPTALSGILINAGTPDFRIFGTRDGCSFSELHNGY